MALGKKMVFYFEADDGGFNPMGLLMAVAIAVVLVAICIPYSGRRRETRVTAFSHGF